MAPMSQEDLEWFKSTFRPIPKPELPDDCIEYSVFYIPSPPASGIVDEVAETRSRLVETQRTANELIKSLLKDYIWQRDGFRLEITKEDGITALRGRTNFGDSIEDEWVIVYILRELTKRHTDIWVRVVDSDGEFLLVEAAGALPAWLEPEVADNRVWIHNGELIVIIPKSNGKRSDRETSEKISLQDARMIVSQEPARLLHSAMIQEEAFYRLRNYPQQINENLHSALLTIPRKVAFLLHQKPAYVSAAVEAFYLRDPIALRPLRVKDMSTLIFSPEDLVTTSVRFTRVGYAQLKSQDFPVPKGWIGKFPPREDRKAYDRAETGMKLSCGFEMLLSDPQNRDKVTVREVNMILEDLETGDEKLPSDEEIETTWSKQDDDEKWLDINFEDLERELGGKGKGKQAEGEPQGRFGDASAQENLQRIVARFEEFLNDDSAGFDGADFIDESGSDDDGDDEDDMSSDGEDKEASFDEEEFSRMMKEMMGMRSMPGSQPISLDRIQELNDDSEEDDTEQIQELSRQMEAELNGTGVLDLKRRAPTSPQGQQAISSKEGALADEEDGNMAERGEGQNSDEENVKINLARNLLESLQSQAGMAGPAGNMLSMMNLSIPEDDRSKKP